MSTNAKKIKWHLNESLSIYKELGMHWISGIIAYPDRFCVSSTRAEQDTSIWVETLPGYNHWDNVTFTFGHDVWLVKYTVYVNVGI